VHFLRLDMAEANTFHFVTVGTSLRLVRNLWDRIAARGGFKASHIVHPTYDRRSWTEAYGTGNCHFFRDDLRTQLPPADAELLASLEGGEVPTIHNMILSDRVVAKLEYVDALSYATFLTKRLFDLYRSLNPAVVIGDFDALHSALGLGVARNLGIPWFALNFSTIPPGNVALCTGLTPATAVTLEPHRRVELRSYADEILRGFESRAIRAPAYLPPRLLSPKVMFDQASTQMRSVRQVLKRRRLRKYRKYSDFAKTYSLAAMFKEAFRLRKNVLFMPHRKLLQKANSGRYVFFGLHMQPEASIDVFAHFFSNQVRVIELISRSLPPTHALLVKLHKSDVPNYSGEQLARLSRFPGVKLVSPYADTYELIKNADLVFAIQGTIGLEAALLGRPVIMFAESPTLAFPNASAFGKTTDLPRLLRAKLAEMAPERDRIVDAFAAYLAPFYPASNNDWSENLDDADIDKYVRLFRLMENHIKAGRVGIRT
jgi:Capsule polysaccharide biosynthesis protein